MIYYRLLAGGELFSTLNHRFSVGQLATISGHLMTYSRNGPRSPIFGRPEGCPEHGDGWASQAPGGRLQRGSSAGAELA